MIDVEQVGGALGHPELALVGGAGWDRRRTQAPHQGSRGRAGATQCRGQSGGRVRRLLYLLVLDDPEPDAHRAVRLEHATRLRQRAPWAQHVVERRREQDPVEGLVRERQVLADGLHEVELALRFARDGVHAHEPAREVDRVGGMPLGTAANIEHQALKLGEACERERVLARAHRQAGLGDLLGRDQEVVL